MYRRRGGRKARLRNKAKAAEPSSSWGEDWDICCPVIARYLQRNTVGRDY